MIFTPTSFLFVLSAVSAAPATFSLTGNGINNVRTYNQGETVITGDSVTTTGGVVGNGAGNTPVTTSSSSSSTFNIGNANGDGPNCFQKCQGSNFFTSEGQCYCGTEALKLSACIFRADPTWPLLPPKGTSAACPNPGEDSAGFEKCVEDSVPHDDPNAQLVVRSCVASACIHATA